ncbi:MAG: hypothetical protein R3F61_04150 [Myxococcota bacterium]
MKTPIPLLLLGLCLPGADAWAQSRVPEREIPPSVLSELRLLESRFDLALASDCDAGRCFSKGCTYVDHAVADRRRSASLPGLGQDPGPGSVPAQEYLTRASCSFAHEESIEPADVQALSRRLQAKLSKGWTVVSVDHQKLPPLPAYVQQPPEPEAEPEVEVPPEPPPPPPPEWTLGQAGRELWNTLLPHLFWMIAVALLTVAATALIWAWRRVGRDSIEDQMLLAELARGEDGNGPVSEGSTADPEEDDAAFVAAQDAAWSERLAAMDPASPDPEVQALIRELLRSGDLPLLAKAVLRYPDTFPAAFPSGGEVASAKLELAEYLKTVDTDALPADPEFFRSLNRHALSAALASQSDAQVVRSLREELGAAGLAQLIRQLPARPGSLLFALAPTDVQYELVRLLGPSPVADMSEMLLASNRMDPAETEHLFGVLTAMRAGAPLPAPRSHDITDRGSEFDAVGALSVLLESLDEHQRSALFEASLNRFHGNLPAWYRGILVSDMLLGLGEEARTDLLLGIDAEPLAAWFSLLDPERRDAVLESAPSSLRQSIRASNVFPSRARQLALAERGRRELARGVGEQLARAGRSFEDLVGGGVV